jgi:hypothetical protein
VTHVDVNGLATEPELDPASPAAVAAPTLVLEGDRDEETLEHGADKSVPGAGG